MHGVFPKERGANIGLGIQNKFSERGRSLNSLAEGFISNYEGDITFRGAELFRCPEVNQSIRQGQPCAGWRFRWNGPPSNGAGITIAMVGGRIAGQTIVSLT